MRIRLRETAARVTVFTILLVLLCASMCSASHSQTSSVAVDLFTQKVPFDGKGPNTPSDAFQPEELVILYASVIYNGAPVVGVLVSFQIDGPANTFNNLTVFGTGSTNQSGLATFSFRVPWPSEHPEEITFGKWSAVATVEVAQESASDTLTFQVGWILQITSIATLNSELMPQTTFFRQDVINFNLTVENIALVEKPGTVTIEVEDAADHPIISIAKENLTFQPGENYANGSSLIPNTATIGNATVWAAIYTAPPEENGVLYSPAISSEFEIAEKTPIHDIGIVSVTLSTHSVYVGGVVDIYVTINNNGTATENNCALIAYYNSSSTWTPIEVLPVALALGSEENVTFSWNTGSVGAGLYQIKVSASLPNDEVDPSPGDNTLVDGFVQVMTPIPPVIHDIGIVSITLSTHSVYVGGVVDIYVTVKNNGTATESNCNVTAYYNSSLIETLQVTLVPGHEENVTFSWATGSVGAGLYQIKAYAALPSNETDISPGDNTFVDGFVQVTVPPVVHDIGITSITLSTHSVYVGGVVDIYVTVKNNGTATESNCNVTAYYNSSLIETLQVTLVPGHEENVTFSWATGSVGAGLYQIKAYAALPSNETDISPGDNTFVDGFVQVTVPPVVHDIGITSITLSTHSVYVGGVVDIYVTVKNNGTATESNCNVTAYYNSSLIETLQVTLVPGHEENVTFSWATGSVGAGLYQIKAYAALPSNETDISPGDNTFVDGFVQVMTPVPPVAPRALYIILFIILLLFLLALLAVLVLRRRKTDESEILEQVSFFT